MFWSGLIYNLSVWWFGSASAGNIALTGNLLTFMVIGVTMLSVWILTRGGESDSKLWIAISGITEVVIFTVFLGWLEILYFIGIMLAISAGVVYMFMRSRR